MKPLFLSFFTLILTQSLSFADVLLTSSGDIYRGTVLSASSDTIVFVTQSGDTRLFQLKDVKGFAYDNMDVSLILTSGEKKIGVVIGNNEKEVIFSFGGEPKSVYTSDIQFISPFKKNAFVYSEFGIKNGSLLMGYNQLNQRIGLISSGSPLGAVNYIMGAYICSAMSLGGGLLVTFGAEAEYLPTISTELVSTNGAAYGNLYADGFKIGVPVGLSYMLSPSFEVGLSFTPLLNITSVYQTFNTNSSLNTYITHTAFGIRPAIEIKLRLGGIIGIGLSAGYEMLSLCDGINVQLKTGVIY